MRPNVKSFVAEQAELAGVRPEQVLRVIIEARGGEPTRIDVDYLNNDYFGLECAAAISDNEDNK